MFGDTVEALKAFHEVIDPRSGASPSSTPCRTRKFEAIRVAEALGKDLYAVRLDTPSSRRGDFFRILEGGPLGARHPRFPSNVKILASGASTNTRSSSSTRSSTATAWAPPSPTRPSCPFALDIMEIEGRPMAKRGKRSGSKQVWRLPGMVTNVVLSAAKAHRWMPRAGRRRRSLKAADTAGEDTSRPPAAAPLPEYFSKPDVRASMPRPRARLRATLCMSKDSPAAQKGSSPHGYCT